MSWWSEGKIKKDKERERSDFELDRTYNKVHKKGNKRYCPKSKDHKHDIERITLPNNKYKWFSSEWERGGWRGDDNEYRWFLDKCKNCGREEIKEETRKV